MQSLSDVKRGAKVGPYPRPLRLRVLAAGRPHNYAQNKQLLSMALGDGTDFIKAVCFDADKFPLFAEESGVVLRNVIVKRDEIVITKQSAVFKCQPVDVPDLIRTQGSALKSVPQHQT